MEQKVEITIGSFDERYGQIKELLTCPICKDLLKEVTTIDECLHMFCRLCIKNKIIEEGLCKCPVCNVDLGIYPLKNLRSDYHWQSIRDKIKFFPTEEISKKPNDEVPEEAYQESKVNSAPEHLPIRIKEKSISSDLNAKKPGGRKALPPRRGNASGLPPIKEPEERHQSSSRPMNLRSRGRGRKQTNKPSKEALSSDKKNKRVEQSEELTMNTLKHVACLVQPPPCNRENEDNGKDDDQIRIFAEEKDDEGSVSVPRSRSARQAQEKRPVTEDLNVPTRVCLGSNNCSRTNPIWFTLVASTKQKSYLPLPPIRPYYLSVKDPNLPASYIQKYLVHKLKLLSEDEVELSLRDDRYISPDWSLKKVVDLWRQTEPEPEKKEGRVGGSTHDFVTVVTYGRRNLFF